jgi:plastocyanin
MTMIVRSLTSHSPLAHAPISRTLCGLLAFALLAGLGSGAGAAEWGTLTGRIVYEGTAPKPASAKVDKDQELCNKVPLFEESLEVGPNGGLKNALVYLRTEKDVAVAPEYADTAKADVVVDNKGCRFEPHVSILRVGQTLVVKNSDPVGHNTKADPMVNAPFNDLIPAGTEIRKTWDKPENLPVTIGCSIHTWMSGRVLVRSNPYAAVTNDKGEFTIKDLPAGQELEFQLWQEKSGYLKNAKNKDVKVDKTGRFKYTVKPGENNLGDFVVSSSIFKK